VSQASIQVEIIASLNEALKDRNYKEKLGRLQSIVIVGNSFGSYISQADIAKYRDLVDGIVWARVAYSEDEHFLQGA
jgi:pimeloyl-ACP methyl ester carboxylesterase